MGKLFVTDIVPFFSFSDSDEVLLKICASVEKGSEHPVGKAIVNESEERDIDLYPPEKFKAESGKGVNATVDGKKI